MNSVMRSGSAAIFLAGERRRLPAACPFRSGALAGSAQLFIMSPHTNNFYGFFIIYDLVN